MRVLYLRAALPLALLEIDQKELQPWAFIRHSGNTQSTNLPWLVTREDELDVKFPVASFASYERNSVEAVTEASAEQPISLLFLDVDDFKRVNTDHGYVAADVVLKEFAERLRRVVGHRGKVYRWGGDEFAVLLPNTTPPEAMSAAERKARSPRSRTSSPAVEIASTYSFSCASPRSMRRSRKGSGYTGGFGRFPCATSMSSAVQCRQDRNRPRSEAASWRVEAERCIRRARR
jgi:diguanylate cyclase (GGDEF)-like protein